ncbi:hypothetical protein GQ43DRAFT_436107 [Delitschia confertaspora ATCC 74209]|uniref:Uncharacterized protein n=1 Tax=Delitschia confertaspora ATCC 74209 TaxID=1513339 RepID=A0A9P4JBA6_9PLEO|nr:hypothetical protein GQ43DRAFT_436107 [Delitschia confertaspora ATCC 74209]
MAEIQRPRRIMALGAPDSGVLNLLKDLTGSAPNLTTDSTAGLSHTYAISTRYYTATIPIWIDEIPSIPDWRTEFLKPEAKEVISVLGAWVYCFRKPVTTVHLESIKETLKAIADVVERHSGYGGDAVCLAVAMPQSTTPYMDLGHEDWEGICMEHGFEFVDGEAKGRNEFGEPVGVERIGEALKSHDWEGGDDDAGFDEDEFGEGLEAEEEEMGMELFGLKSALHQGDEEGDDEEEGGDEDEAKQVEELENMMRRMQAIKGMIFYFLVGEYIQLTV